MPALVVRAKPAWRLAGPVLVVVGAAAVALGQLWGAGIIAIALLFLPMLWIRLLVSGVSIRRRGWRGQSSTIRLDTIDTLRLRRMLFGPTRILGRGLSIGGFWGAPLTLRLQTGSDVRLQLRCVWWNGWQSVARFMASEPGLDVDDRTRGRLDSYVGPAAAPVVTSVRL
jgi:hypothetical protein